MASQSRLCKNGTIWLCFFFFLLRSIIICSFTVHSCYSQREKYEIFVHHIANNSWVRFFIWKKSFIKIQHDNMPKSPSFLIFFCVDICFLHIFNGVSNHWHLLFEITNLNIRSMFHLQEVFHTIHLGSVNQNALFWHRKRRCLSTFILLPQIWSILCYWFVQQSIRHSILLGLTLFINIRFYLKIEFSIDWIVIYTCIFVFVINRLRHKQELML